MKSYILSISSISAMQIVEMSTNTFTIFTVILQLIIFLITVRKLYLDIKHNKYKSLESEENKVKKEYPFLTALKELFNKTKFL